MRRKTISVLSIWLALALLLPLFNVAAANNDVITMQVAPYFDGLARNGNWVPLQVLIRNDGDVDFHGELRYTGRPSRSGQTASFRLAVSVPANSVRRFTFYLVPNSKDLYDGNVVLGLLTGGDRSILVAQEKVRLQGILDDLHVLAAVVGFSPSTLGLPTTGTRGARTPALYWSALSRQAFPDRLVGLSSVGVLLVNGNALTQFTDAQLQTLVDWVHDGGTLLLSGDPSTLRFLPAGERPAHGKGELVSLPARYLAAWAPGSTVPDFSLSVHVVQPENGVKTLLAAGQMPLVLRRAVGVGSVVYLTFPLAGTSLGSWDGAPSFWTQLLVKTAIHPLPMSGMALFQGSYTTLLSQVAGETLPSMNILFLLFFIYLLVVGPGCYLLLKRRRQLAYAWVIIPLLTLLFSGVTYGVARLKRRLPPRWSQIALVRVDSSRGVAFSSGNAVLLAQEETAVTTRFAGDTVVAPPVDGNPYGSGAKRRAVLTLREGDGASATFATQQRWGAVVARFSSVLPFTTTVMPGKPLLRASPLRFDTASERWEGTLTNNLPEKLFSPILVIGHQLYLFDDLSPGHDLSLTHVRQHGWFDNDLAAALSLRSMSFRPGFAPKNANQKLWLRLSLLQPLLDREDVMMVPEKWPRPVATDLLPPAYLVGWTQSAWPRVHFASAERPPDVRALTAFILPVQLQSDAGSLRILGTKDFSSSVWAPHAEGDCGPYGLPKKIFREGAWQMQVTFRALRPSSEPPLTLDWKITGVEDNPEGNDLSYLHFYLFNWKRGRMVAFPLDNKAIVHIPDPAPYWRDGQMQAALQANDHWRGGCVGMELQAMEVAP